MQKKRKKETIFRDIEKQNISNAIPGVPVRIGSRKDNVFCSHLLTRGFASKQEQSNF